MDYLPVFLRLRAQPVVVVGGGPVALRKALWLRRAGAHVTVVAPRLHPELGQRVAPRILPRGVEHQLHLVHQMRVVVAKRGDVLAQRVEPRFHLRVNP